MIGYFSADMIVALAIVAAIGDAGRFETAEKLVSYLGLNPSVRQSGSRPAHHGGITRQGRGHARGMLVEAAWAPGPLRAFFELTIMKLYASLSAKRLFERSRARGYGSRARCDEHLRACARRQPVQHLWLHRIVVEQQPRFSKPPFAMSFSAMFAAWGRSLTSARPGMKIVSRAARPATMLAFVSAPSHHPVKAPFSEQRNDRSYRTLPQACRLG
jgi:Transposase IS116/IS110/IS902 family